MSTYNGEKYLIEQLDSIKNQDYQNISILIRDDGSKDNTIAIIEKYISDKNEVVKVIKNIVADYLGDLDLQFMVKRSNVTTDIGTLVYTLKVKK